MKKILVSILLVVVMMFATTTTVFAISYYSIDDPTGILTETTYDCDIVEGELKKTPLYKHEYVYNNSNLIAEDLLSMYDSTNETWVPDRYYTYDYNASGDMIHFLAQNYDADKKVFVFDEEEVVEYTTFHEKSKRIGYEVENGTKYVHDERTYTFNNLQQMTQETYSRRDNPTADLILTNKTDYEYTNGYCTKETSQKRTTLGTYEIYEIAEYTFDENGNRINQFYNSMSDGETYSYSQITFEFDQQNRTTRVTNYKQTKNFESRNLVEKSKTEYSYDGDTTTKIYYEKISEDGYAIKNKHVTVERSDFFQDDYYEWSTTDGDFILKSGDREQAIYENGKVVSIGLYEYDGDTKEYVMFSDRVFTYPIPQETPNAKKGNAGVVILIIILVLILLFVGAYILWKFEFEGKLKLKENERIMKFADVVYKPIDNFLFTKVFKKKQ